MTISGGRTKRLNIFCHVTGFASDFLSFIVVELIRFFHVAIQLLVFLVVLMIILLSYKVVLITVVMVILLQTPSLCCCLVDIQYMEV